MTPQDVIGKRWRDLPTPYFKPGWLLTYANGQQELVGHVNEAFGVCDDCRSDNDDQVIVSVDVVWEEQPNMNYGGWQ